MVSDSQPPHPITHQTRHRLSMPIENTMTKQQQKKAKIGKKLAKQLILTSDLLMDYYAACLEVGDPVRLGHDDARKMLSVQCRAYSSLMCSVYGE